MVEVLAEPAVVDLGPQVAVGRGDDARLEVQVRRAAHPAEPAALEDPEQRALIGGR